RDGRRKFINDRRLHQALLRDRFKYMGNGFADIPAYFQFLRNMVEGRFNVRQPTSSSYLFIAIRLRFFGPLEGSRSHSKASNEGINTRKLCPIRLGARFLRPELRDRLPHRHPPPVRVRPINLMLDTHTTPTNFY